MPLVRYRHGGRAARRPGRAAARRGVLGGRLPGGDLTDPAGVIRPAVESALAIARAGLTADPVVHPPPALRPYLSFAKQSPRSLEAVARVVEGDSEFRARVAAVVDEDQVGRAGWLWLTRPEGWEGEIAALEADDTARRAAVADEREERSATRKLAAAQAATARAEAEAAARLAEAEAVRAEMAGERAARAAAEARVAELEAVVSDLTEERAAVVRNLKELEARFVERATEMNATRARLREAEDELRQMRATPGPPVAPPGAAAGTDRGPTSPAPGPATAAPPPSPTPPGIGPPVRAEADGTAPSPPGAVAGGGAPSPPSAAAGGEAPSPPSAAAGGEAPSPSEAVAGGAASPPVALPSDGGPAGRSAPASAGADRGTAGPPAGFDPGTVAEGLARAAEGAEALAAGLAALARAVQGGQGGPAAGSVPTAPAPPPDSASASVSASGPTRPAAPDPPPVDDPPATTGRVVRTPVPLPGGMFDDSVEAAEHLLRTPGAVLVVDGYNVSMEGWPDRVPAEQRRRLVSGLSDLAHRTSTGVEVVFDGAEVEPLSVPNPSRQLVRVRFSDPGVEADDVVIDLVGCLPVGTPVIVASSDNRVREGARRRGANLLHARQLVAVLRR